jgi:dihydrolipoamide dehydrogenase
VAEKFDVIILGMGPGGENVAGRLLGAGKNVAVVERELWEASAPTGRASPPRRCSGRRSSRESH